MTNPPCVVCGAAVVNPRANQTTCGSSFCTAENRRLAAARRSEERHKREKERAAVTGGAFVAVERAERLNVLRELVRWEDVQAEAIARRERGLANEAKRRARELVSVLGFDPLTYIPDRATFRAMEEQDGLGRLVSRRLGLMLRALPATTNELAEVSGVHARNVGAYLLPLLERGEITRTVVGTRTTWAVPE